MSKPSKDISEANRPVDAFLAAADADDSIASLGAAEEQAQAALRALAEITDHPLDSDHPLANPTWEKRAVRAADALSDERLRLALGHARRLHPGELDGALVRMRAKRGLGGIAEKLESAAKQSAKLLEEEERSRERARQARREQKNRPPETSNDQPPLIVSVPGYSVFYLRLDLDSGTDYRDADERLLRGLLRRFHPSVPIWTEPKGDGEARPVPASQIVEEHSTPCDEIAFDWAASVTHWIPNRSGGGLLYVGLDRVPPVEPAHDADVAQWLERFAGDHHAKLLDWLASYQDLSQITAALVLGGPGGAGKGLLATAIAQRWGGAPCSYKDVLGSSFNAALKRNPVVFLDEQAPIGKFRIGSGPFKSLVGERAHQLTEKKRTTGTLYGALRMVVATNDDDPLGLAEEEMSKHSLDAAGDRILFVKVPDDQRNALDGRRVREWIHTKNGQPGALVRHIEWLRLNRRVEPGGRFMVNGNGEAWIRAMRTTSPLARMILFAIVRAARPSVRVDHPAVWFRDGDVFVSSEGLMENWRVLSGRAEGVIVVPPVVEIGKALAGMSPDASFTKPRWAQRDGSRARVWRIPGSTVIDFADQAGVQVDDLQRRLTAGPGGPGAGDSTPARENDDPYYG